MTDERLAHWDNMIEVLQEMLVEAGRCAYECTNEIRRLQGEDERLKNDYNRAESWRVELAEENERLREEIESWKHKHTVAMTDHERGAVEKL